MGASNVAAVFATWAGKISATSFQCLVYMALVAKDSDAHPWYGQGHAALAEHALGRPAPIQRADIKAVERAIAPLAEAGAITADRRAAPRRDGPSTVRYRLNLTGAVIPRKPGDDPSTGTGAVDPLRPPENGPNVPRKTGQRPPETVPTSPGNRGTEENEEPRGARKPGRNQDLRTDVTVARANDTANEPKINPSQPPARASPTGRCPHHPAQPAGTSRGQPRCRVCQAQGRKPPDLRVIPGGAA